MTDNRQDERLLQDIRKLHTQGVIGVVKLASAMLDVHPIRYGFADTLLTLETIARIPKEPDNTDFLQSPVNTLGPPAYGLSIYMPKDVMGWERNISALLQGHTPPLLEAMLEKGPLEKAAEFIRGHAGGERAEELSFMLSRQIAKHKLEDIFPPDPYDPLQHAANLCDWASTRLIGFGMRHETALVSAMERYNERYPTERAVAH